ncbi:MAG: peptidylprolyl isomerase [Deltaproteobacteria bacterium]|nr:peptidylprolyl isomerase [Deltaproteobacteria bacterium]MBK8237553.1 peptidylprolyl isomerase [Deltaproteobacteria bacterium]MBP7291476.1 peptidylprolyl isomerase [Nannocystaceae bacterium]
MKVAPDTVVTLSYDITNEAGEIIENSDISGPISFLAGRSGLIPGLDKRLVGMEAGTEATFEFPPEEAFGRAGDGPTRQLSRREFPAEAKLEVGAQFEAGAGGQTVRLRVVDCDADTVTVRFIHPLADQKITMGVRVEAVRPATAAERESGRVQSAPPPPKK